MTDAVEELPPSEALAATILSEADEPLSASEITDAVEVPVSSRTVRHGVQQLAERGIAKTVVDPMDPGPRKFILDVDDERK